MNTPPRDYSEFDYNLPQSDFTYKVKITGVTTAVKKGAYQQRKDQYSVPEPLDGYILSVNYAMTNPYDREMMAPVPKYYFITSTNNEYFTESTTRSKSCMCDIDNGVEVLDSKGKSLWMTAEGKCGYDDFCVRFRANETKEFTVRFTDPIVATVRQLVFSSFHLEWNNPSNTYPRDVGVVIDVDQGKVIGEKRF